MKKIISLIVMLISTLQLFATGTIKIDGVLYFNQSTVYLKCNQSDFNVTALNGNGTIVLGAGSFNGWVTSSGLSFDPATSLYPISVATLNYNQNVTLSFAGLEACTVYVVRTPPAPTISASASLCAIGSSATFSASYLNNSLSYQWSSTGQVSINGINATATPVNTIVNSATVQNNFGGRVFVKYIDACSNNSPNSSPVNIGLPVLDTRSDGTFSFGNPTYICRNRGYTIFVDNPNNSTYTWSTNNSSAYTNYYYPGTQTNFGSSQTGGSSFNITMNGSNGCGNMSKNISVVVMQCGFMAYSNPAQSNLKVSYQAAPETKTIMPESFVLYDQKMKEALIYKPETSKFQETYDLDVSRLPRGEYYLHINYLGKNEKGSFEMNKDMVRIRLN